MKTTTNIYEPYRYLENAKEIIKTKLKIEDGLYNDAKYVKMAANTAYNGVLLALKDWATYQLKIKVPKRQKGKRGETIDFYRELLAKHNKKMLKILNEIYNLLHLFAGYDGTLSVSVLKDGLKLSKELIDWIYKQIKDKI